jgi:two-component system phosphate regulon sensor histidine kinase PhoR
MLLFTTKNPSPEQLAWLTATNNAGVLFFFTIGAKVLFPNSIAWILVFLIPIISLVFGYLAIYNSLHRFIYRKVKLIYKTIHSMKTPTTSSVVNVDMKNHTIDEVEQEVVEWAQNWTKEISSLKSMEVYRREFLGNVSHELKTPIFNIQGYLLTLLDGGMEDPDINYKYLTRAAKNTERMEKIVADLGYISKFEAGKLQLHLSNFDICQLVKDVLDDSELKAAETNITLSFKNNPQKPRLVTADIEHLRRVVVNLISNSIKYGKENGHTLVGFYDLDNNILIEISDDGKGITQDHIPRLFERFYRVDKGRSRSEGGSGLGLAIVKHILEAHQQTITARSRVDLGSTFGFTLKKAE